MKKGFATYVDTAELLHEHDEERRLRSAAIAAHSEEFLPEALASTLGLLNFKELVSIVHVACGLDLMIAKTTQGVEGLVEFALLHVPTG